MENLCWGSAKENEQDKKRHGTYNHGGIKTHNAKLDDKRALEMLRLIEEDALSQKEIGRIFGVSQSTVSYVKLRKRWTDV